MYRLIGIETTHHRTIDSAVRTIVRVTAASTHQIVWGLYDVPGLPGRYGPARELSSADRARYCAQIRQAAEASLAARARRRAWLRV